MRAIRLGDGVGGSGLFIGRAYLAAGDYAIPLTVSDCYGAACASAYLFIVGHRV